MKSIFRAKLGNYQTIEKTKLICFHVLSKDGILQSFVCFRQRCVIENPDLIISGRSGEDAAHGGASDLQAAGDFRFA